MGIFNYVTGKYERNQSLDMTLQGGSTKFDKAKPFQTAATIQHPLSYNNSIHSDGATQPTLQDLIGKDIRSYSALINYQSMHKRESDDGGLNTGIKGLNSTTISSQDFRKLLDKANESHAPGHLEPMSLTHRKERKRDSVHL